MGNRIAAGFGQALAYLAFMALVGYFASAPAYQHFPPGKGLVKLSFTHTTARLGECRKRSAEEMADLPPNMRKPMECPRERSPLELLIRLDGETVYHDTLQPSGLWGGGATTVYQRFPVAAGTHVLEARLRDDADLETYNFTRKARIRLEEASVFVIDFAPSRGGFLFGRSTVAGTREDGA